MWIIYDKATKVISTKLNPRHTHTFTAVCGLIKCFMPSYFTPIILLLGLSIALSACNAGDLGSIPGSGRSPGEGNNNPLKYSCLGNSMDRGTWWAIVHGVAESDTTEQITLSLSKTGYHSSFSSPSYSGKKESDSESVPGPLYF